jgi:hypothetical protein
MRSEDYGLIGGLQSAALVRRNGSIDRLRLPRVDSASCLTVLLSDESHGRWLVATSVEVTGSSRRYRPVFWPVNALALKGRVGEARALLEAASPVDHRPRPACRGGVRRRSAARQVGNFPHASSHLPLSIAAVNLTAAA